MKFVRFLLFNWFTNSYRKRMPALFPWDRRIFLAMMEFQYLISVLFFPILLFMIPLIVLLVTKTVSEQTVNVFWLLLLSALSVIILNKDLWNGQSIVHRERGYQVVNAKTGEPASKVRCFLRNLTFVVWIVEVIPLLFSPSRRIGDLMAGTRLVKVRESDPKEILEEMKETEWNADLKWTLLLSFIFAVLSMGYFYSKGIFTHHHS